MYSSATLIKRTNKAELHRLPDGSILKRYVTPNGPLRARHDRRSLDQLQLAFGRVDRHGWTYSVVRSLWADIDNAMVCMEMAPGQVISEQPASELCRAEYHAGVWLALYHERMLDGALHGRLYTDFTVHNVLIDWTKRSVTAIDPGMGFPRFGTAYEDIVKHIHSVVVGLVLRRRGPLASITSFLKGYTTTTTRKLQWWPYYRGLSREFVRQLRDYQNSSWPRFLLYPLVMLLLCPIYLGLVPARLCVRNEA
jgi:hypothetical protein